MLGNEAMVSLSDKLIKRVIAIKRPTCTHVADHTHILEQLLWLHGHKLLAGISPLCMNGLTCAQLVITCSMQK